MDYEKKYKNALTIAQSRFKIEKDESVLTCLGMMFPELREPEDERVRKGLIKLLTVASEAYLVESTGIKKDSYLAYLEKQEQNPAWSEVELLFRGEKVTVKRPFYRDDKGRGYSTAELDEDVAWNALRVWCEKKGISLYDLYPKAEWSEQDETIIEGACNALEIHGHTKLASMLKSLRPQYHGDVTMTEAYKMGLEAGKASSWKPSEEQMEAFRIYLYNPQYIDNSEDIKIKLVESLYNDLLKLTDNEHD